MASPQDKDKTMIKALSLFVVVFNPVDDTTTTVKAGSYEASQCFINEMYINKKNSAMNIALTNNNLELVSTRCDDS